MKDSVFDYHNYKRYLIDLGHSQPKKGRGFRTALAEAANCQIASISQVLGGDRDFTLEQAEGINQFLGHNEDEARFFLLLLNRDRAGTKALRSRYEKEIAHAIQRHLTLKDRFKAKEVLSREAQATYYSSWYYAAIHIALTVPSLRTKEALARALNLNAATVATALGFLTNVGLAEQKGTEYLPGVANIYIGNDSPLIVQHHSNWRMQAISSLDPNNSDDLHYSAVVSIPLRDFENLKAHFAKSIEEARKRWNEATHEEQLCVITLDWFQLSKSTK